MSGLVPGTLDFLSAKKQGADGRDEPTAVRLDFCGRSAWR
jgi:hypothetical protein